MEGYEMLRARWRHDSRSWRYGKFVADNGDTVEVVEDFNGAYRTLTSDRVQILNRGVRGGETWAWFIPRDDAAA